MSVILDKQDYYMEDGRYVFTAFFHIKRGYCCGNRCRHCPYIPKHQKHTTALDDTYVKKETGSGTDSKK